MAHESAAIPVSSKYHSVSKRKNMSAACHDRRIPATHGLDGAIARAGALGRRALRP
jgi:hypothetical protein